jgi:hypothetical protein
MMDISDARRVSHDAARPGKEENEEFIEKTLFKISWWVQS